MKYQITLKAIQDLLGYVTSINEDEVEISGLIVPKEVLTLGCTTHTATKVDGLYCTDENIQIHPDWVVLSVELADNPDMFNATIRKSFLHDITLEFKTKQEQDLFYNWFNKKKKGGMSTDVLTSGSNP